MLNKPTLAEQQTLNFQIHSYPENTDISLLEDG